MSGRCLTAQLALVRSQEEAPHLGILRQTAWHVGEALEISLITAHHSGAWAPGWRLHGRRGRRGLDLRDCSISPHIDS